MSLDAASLTVFRRQAQLTLEALYPAQIQLAGALAAVPCAGGNVKHTGAAFGAGGLMHSYDLVFRVRTELLAEAPEVTTQLTFAGQSWRIMRVHTPNSDVVYLLGCDSPHKQ